MPLNKPPIAKTSTKYAIELPEWAIPNHYFTDIPLHPIGPKFPPVPQDIESQEKPNKRRNCCIRLCGLSEGISLRLFCFLLFVFIAVVCVVLLVVGIQVAKEVSSKDRLKLSSLR